MTITSDYLDMVERINTCIQLPPIRDVHIGHYDNTTQGNSKFGAIVLADDTVGLTYVAFGDTLRDVQLRLEHREFIGLSPARVALLYAKKAGWQRALGMAAINAISQYVLTHSGASLTAMRETLDLLDLQASDHVGMVGYFPPLVDQVRALRTPLIVLELDEKWLQQKDGFEVTLDPTRLSCCNKVLCTATTLINHTLDAVLAHCAGAEQIFLIGPTAGCLPDPLFARGVTVIGGCQVMNCDRFIELWSTHQRWREATRRYTIGRENYLGFETWLQQLT